MPGLVGTAFLQLEVFQQRVPNTLGHVIVVQWLSQPVTEYELAELAGGLVLGFECLVHGAKHGNFPLRAVRFCVLGLAVDECFTYQDFPLFEIHVLPLEAINLPRSHAGVKTHQVVVVVILSDRFEDLFYLIQGEGLDVYLLLFQRLDIQIGIREAPFPSAEPSCYVQPKCLAWKSRLPVYF